MKKLFSSLLTILILNFSIIPAFAEPGTIIDTEWVTELDINKASKGQVVEFKSIEDTPYENNIIIPAGTIFKGKIHSLKHSRWAYRRAKARITLDEMTFPNGEQYKIKGRTDRKVLKGSALGNTVKGICLTPVGLVVTVIGGAVVLCEAVTIVGLILAGPTSAAFEGTVGKLTKGVNYKKEPGDEIKINLRQPHTGNYSEVSE